MKLLTKQLRRQLPKQQNVERIGDYIAYARFFMVCGNWTWYACEFDGEDIFDGFVIGPCPEFGPFSLQELESLRYTFKWANGNTMQVEFVDNKNAPAAVERDLMFKPAKLRDIPEVAAHLHL